MVLSKAGDGGEWRRGPVKDLAKPAGVTKKASKKPQKSPKKKKPDKATAEKRTKKGRRSAKPKKKTPASGDALDDDGEAAAVPAPQAVRGPPSEAAREKIVRMKERQRQLSTTQFEAAKARAATIAAQPPQAQSDWLCESYQRHTAASDLERDGLTAECLQTLPPRNSLEQRLQALERRWEAELATPAHAGRGPGQLSALFVCPAALGCVDIIKSCPELNRWCKVAKLFAKHFKVEEQVTALREPACMGAGTPNRLAKLIDVGALKLDRLKWIVLDVRLDVKGRTILDLPEVREDWWQLWEAHLKQRVASGGAKLVLL